MQQQNNKSLTTSIAKAVALALTSAACLMAAFFYWGKHKQDQSSKTQFVRESSDMSGSLVSTESENTNDAEETISPEVVSTATDLEEELMSEEKIFENPKIELLAQILDSRNDNDPRLDSELKNLNKKDKDDLRKFYHQMELEDRNGRGTAVFLLGRSIESLEDVNFISEVLTESPCLSLSDCQSTQIDEYDEDDHDTTADVTLVYPQIVAIRSIEMRYQSAKADVQQKMQETLRAATAYPNPRVSQAARHALSAIIR